MSDFKVRFRGKLRAFIMEEPYVPPPPPPPRPGLSILRPEDTESFIAAAQGREEQVFMQITQLLDSLYVQYPLRVQRMRRDIKWLRHQAKRYDLPWGTR